MNRKELLEKGEVKDYNEILESDTKFIKRKKRDLEDKIEDLESQLKSRFRNETVLDSSAVEVIYGGIKETKGLLELYKSFEKEYLG